MVRNQYTEVLAVVLISNLIEVQSAQFVPVDSCLSLINIISTSSCQNKSKVSHCVQDDNNRDGLVCTDWKWMEKGKCPYYNTYAGRLDDKKCVSRSGTCADKQYNSTQSQSYSGCYPNPILSTTVKVTTEKITEEAEDYRSTTITGQGEKGIKETEKNGSTTITGQGEKRIEETEKNRYLVPLIIVITIAVISVIINIIWCCLRWRKRKHFSHGCAAFSKRKCDDKNSSLNGAVALLSQNPAASEETEMARNMEYNERGESESMTESQISALNQCRVKMVEKIDPKQAPFKENLTESEIFPPLMLEYILNKPTRLERIGSLLDNLINRNYLAFDKFVKCLRNSGYFYIAQEIVLKEKLISDKERPEHAEVSSSCSTVKDIDTQDKPVRNGQTIQK